MFLYHCVHPFHLYVSSNNFQPFKYINLKRNEKKNLLGIIRCFLSCLITYHTSGIVFVNTYWKLHLELTTNLNIHVHSLCFSSQYNEPFPALVKTSRSIFKFISLIKVSLQASNKGGIPEGIKRLLFWLDYSVVLYYWNSQVEPANTVRDKMWLVTCIHSQEKPS